MRGSNVMVARNGLPTILALTQKRYPSSTEVAKLAGVSQSAVSCSFTPGASVSQKIRAKVMAAADALGFRPSLIPQIMLTERSGFVAIVVVGLENPFYGRVWMQS